MGDQPETQRAVIKESLITALTKRIENATQVVIARDGCAYWLDRTEHQMLISMLISALRSNEMQANIDRGLSLVADLEAAGTISPAVSTELQIALSGGYQPADYKLPDLPDWDDLRGCAPDATGDLSSEDFVRKLRDDWR